MKKVNVYDVKKYIEGLNFNSEKYTTATDHQIAILEGENGVIIINSEGCGGTFKDSKECYEIPLFDLKDGENRVFLGKADFEHEMTIEDIINSIPHEDMLLIDFMDKWKYKKRVRENLEEVLEFINKIGLDSKKYCTKGYIRKNYEGRWF